MTRTRLIIGRRTINIVRLHYEAIRSVHLKVDKIPINNSLTIAQTELWYTLNTYA